MPMETATTGSYDAIVIGSGIGGMTSAALLARLKGRRVLVVERHFARGGQTHEFTRKGRYRWDVGLHYVGGMGPGEPGRRVMDFITGGGVRWTKLPDPYDTFIYPGLTYEASSDPDKYANGLISLFPAEEQAIREYFKDAKKVTAWFSREVMAGVAPCYLGALIRVSNFANRRKALMTTGQYLNARFKDQRLKALLASQWGCYGLPPGRSAFAAHAMAAVMNYSTGGYYPEGGAGRLAEHIAPAVEKAGGRFLLKSEVTGIIVENGRAVGVRVKAASGGAEGTAEFRAPVVISDAGAFNTYLKLLPKDVDIPFRDEISGFKHGASAVVLYAALRESPVDLGFKVGNCWIYEGFDHDKTYEENGPLLLEGRPSHCFVSFPSLRDPAATDHVAEVVSFCDYGLFDKWKDQPWLKRDKEYYRLKDRISDGLIGLVEKHFRGFKDRIEYRELSTPLTMEYFTAKPRGEFYGIALTPERFTRKWCSVRTPVDNLYLTGSDAFTIGVNGAMFSGVAAAGAATGPFGFFKIMKDILGRPTPSE